MLCHNVHKFMALLQRLQHPRQFGIAVEQSTVTQNIAKIDKCGFYTLYEMFLAFVQSSVAVSPHCLHYTQKSEFVQSRKEFVATLLFVQARGVVVIIGQTFTGVVGDFGLGIIEQRGKVVIGSAFSSSLIVNKINFVVAEHHVARLEIPI